MPGPDFGQSLHFVALRMSGGYKPDEVDSILAIVCWRVGLRFDRSLLAVQSNQLKSGFVLDPEDHFSVFLLVIYNSKGLNYCCLLEDYNKRQKAFKLSAIQKA